MSANDTVYIKFFAGVNKDSAKVLMDTIDQQIAKGKNIINLLISTQGGTVFHGISIYNYLKGIPTEINTHNFGSIDSIGNIIFVAGEKRFSVPNARFMLHPVSVTYSQNVSMEEEKIEETLKGLKIDNSNIAKIVGIETSKTEKEILKAMANRTTLNPDEAKKFGIVHEIKSDLYPKGATVITINQA